MCFYICSSLYVSCAWRNVVFNRFLTNAKRVIIGQNWEFRTKHWYSCSFDMSVQLYKQRCKITLCILQQVSWNIRWGIWTSKQVILQNDVSYADLYNFVWSIPIQIISEFAQWFLAIFEHKERDVSRKSMKRNSDMGSDIIQLTREHSQMLILFWTNE